MNILGKIYYCIYKIANKLNHIYLCSAIQGDTESLLVKGRSRILFPEKMIVGTNCCINDSVVMHCGGKIVLGDYVTISTGAILVSRAYDTSHWIQQCENAKSEKLHIMDEIHLGNHTWIGAGAIILPGTRITGVGVIVGAGSVVSGQFSDSYVLLAGVPAKIVKRYQV